MTDPSAFDLRPARAGTINRHNYARLGYERLTWGMYGRLPSTEGLGTYEARRVRWMAHVRAVLAAYGDTPVALAGPTALQVLGVALPTSCEDWQRCHVIVPAGAHRSRRDDVIAHRNHDFRVWARVGGMPVEHPVDAWVRLHSAALDGLIEVGDGLVRRKRPLLTMEALAARVDQLAGTTGILQVRRALRWVRPGTDSISETRTRLALLRAGLPEPSVNLPVFCRAAGYWYHVDMGYEAARLAVEYDGQGHGEREQREIDAERRRDLQDEGWLIIVVTSRQLADPEPLIGSVERALALRSPR